MQVGDLVQEKLTMWSGDRLGRVGIVMEIAENSPGVPVGGHWVRWCGNVDWDIIYPEDVITLSKVAA